MTATRPASRSGNSPVSRGLNKTVATAFGAVYLLIGALGFAVTGGFDFAGNEGGMLFGIFMVNPLHNIVHLLIGALLLYAGLKGTERMAASANMGVGATYALVFLYGLVVPLSSAANFVALNSADNVLHLLSAVVLIGTAVFGLRGARSSTTI